MEMDWTKIPREALQAFFWQVARAIAKELERIMRQDFVRTRPGPNGEPIVVPMNLEALKTALFLYARYLPLSRAAVAGGYSGSWDRDIRERQWREQTMGLAELMHRVAMSLLSIECVYSYVGRSGNIKIRFIGLHIPITCRIMRAFDELSRAAVSNVPARLGSEMRRQFATACMMQKVGFRAADTPNATECDILRHATPDRKYSAAPPDGQRQGSKRGRHRRTLRQLTGMRGRVEFVDRRPVWRSEEEEAA